MILLVINLFFIGFEELKDFGDGRYFYHPKLTVSFYKDYTGIAVGNHKKDLSVLSFDEIWHPIPGKILDFTDMDLKVNFKLI